MAALLPDPGQAACVPACHGGESRHRPPAQRLPGPKHHHWPAAYRQRTAWHSRYPAAACDCARPPSARFPATAAPDESAPIAGAEGKMLDTGEHQRIQADVIILRGGGDGHAFLQQTMHLRGRILPVLAAVLPPAQANNLHGAIGHGGGSVVDKQRPQRQCSPPGEWALGRERPRRRSQIP